MNSEIGVVKYTRYKMDNQNLKILNCDSSFEEITGYTPEDVKNGLTQKDLITEENWNDYAPFIDSKPEAYLEHSLRCKDGHKIFVFCFGKTSEDGKIADITITDITHTKLLQNEILNIEKKYNDTNKKLKEKNLFLEKIFDNFAGGLGIFKVENNIAIPTYLSSSYYKMVGKSIEQLQKYTNNFFDLVFCDDLKKLQTTVDLCLKTKKTIGNEFRFIKFNGGYRWLEVHLSYFEENGKPLILAVFFDITNKKETEIEYQIFNDRIRLISENKNELLFNYDNTLDTLFVSYIKDGKICEKVKIKNFIYNYSEIKIIHEDDKDFVIKVFKELLKKTKNKTFECRLLVEDKTYKWFNVFIISRKNEKNNVNRISGRLTCINDEKLKQEALLKQAEKDALTGIYNHFAFEKLINEALATSEDTTCALFMMDIDNFKLVNDTLGHYAGDVLLKKIAQTLVDIFKETGECARMGGDEFAVFLPKIEDENLICKIAQTICTKINNIKLENTPNTFSVSIGICMKKLSDLNFKSLYMEADYALYAAKRNGRNCYYIFNNNRDIIAENSLSPFNSYLEDEGWILDDMDDMVYISDIESYDLLYVNNAVKKNYPATSVSNLNSKKCYKIFHNRNTPCDFCTHKNWTENKNYTGEFNNDISGKKYILKERHIRWKNKKARLQTLVDVSNLTNVHTALSSRFEFEDALYRAILQIVSNTDTDSSRYEAMRIIGEYYKADRTVLFVMKEDKSYTNIYEWHTETAIDMSSKLIDHTTSIPTENLKEFANERGVIIIDDTKKLQDLFPEYYEKFYRGKIWSFYAVPLEKENVIKGYIAVFNANVHLAEMTLLNMISAFLANEIVRHNLHLKQQYNVTHDRLTGLLNRASYIDYVISVCEPKSMGIVSADINSLKKINHDFGLSYGNKVVIDIANILRECFHDNLVFRFGSDDFVVICENIDLDSFSIKVNKARGLLSEHNPGAALGYAWDDYDIDINRLSDHAEQMMISEKNKYYNNISPEVASNKSYILNGLLNELKAKNFIVYLQPKVDMTTESFFGAEALIRYKNSDGAIVAPNKFIPLFEKTKTISHLDLYVAEEICILLNKWKKLNIPLIPISVNISRETLLESDFIEKIEALTQKYHIDKKYLELEITETLGDMEYTLISSLAARLHDKGFKLSMDDFGNKYSSISMLSFMKFDSLKLDRSLVFDLCNNNVSYKVAKHVVSMCNDIGLKCIAEGIEFKEQADALKAINCNIAQGYLYCKPIPVQEFEIIYKKQI